jgi:hypothetical protein
MATTQFSDIFDPEVFDKTIQESQLELNRFISSGVAVTSPLLDNMISEHSFDGVITNFKPLGTPEPNYGTDNPATKSTPQKVSSQQQYFRAASQNQSWSVMDLAHELALDKPASAITSRIGAYWATNNEKRIISSVLGLVADNVANDGNDMVIDLTTDSTVGDANRISASAVLDAKQTMGDHASSLQIIAMHSVIKTRLQKQNLIDYIPDARGETTIPTYLGYIVVEDDSMPVDTGGANPEYTCVLFGRGAIGTGYRSPKVPSEVWRDPAAGNGSGEEVLFSRRTDLIHPFGFAFQKLDDGGSPLGDGITANRAALERADNWDRVFNRKNIPLAFLIVND